MMVWKIHKKITAASPQKRRQQIINLLLKNRNISSPAQKTKFLKPPHPKTLTSQSVNINPTKLRASIKLIKKYIKDKALIIVYGDYDADGICATAILWEALHSLKANAIPFIPHRFKHGYGISNKGIDQIIKDHKLTSASHALIITVDNGIVAHNPIKYAKKKGFKVIVTDHHVAASTLPLADGIVHTTKLAGAGVSWMLAKQLIKSLKGHPSNFSSLELAAIGSIADMVPLIDANRSIAAYGQKQLAITKRPGLLQLFKIASIKPSQISTYGVNFIIAPRLNAMGRLGNALDSLRLLCTTNKTRALRLANKLDDTNKKRQDLTQDQLNHALKLAKPIVNKQKVLIIKHDSFHEGVIGLIAGRLMEKYFLPVIVLSKGKNTSKASARSIPGFNLIDSLRQLNHLLVDVGGHPMAAGFTIKNSLIKQFTQELQKIAKRQIKAKLLKKQLLIDCQLNIKDINFELLNQISLLKPFGIKNPRPLFVLKNIEVKGARAVGKQKSHLSLFIEKNISCIGFGLGEHAAKLSSGDKVDLAFTLEENQYNGKTKLQLKLKDIQNN